MQRQRNFNYFQYPPWVNLTEGKPAHGLIITLLNELGKRINFTYEIVRPEENVIGVRNANGQWNGIMKLIQDNKVFLGAAPITISANRIDIVNFSYPFDLQPYTFAVRRPQEISKALLFIEPFTPLVSIFGLRYLAS